MDEATEIVQALERIRSTYTAKSSRLSKHVRLESLTVRDVPCRNISLLELKEMQSEFYRLLDEYTGALPTDEEREPIYPGDWFCLCS